MSAGPALDAILVTCDVSPWAEAQRVALLDALEALHCNVEVASWDEQRDWGSAAGIVVVSPFNTAPLHDEFLAWVERCEEQATLVNSAALLNLDSHRRYLFDLEAAGVEIREYPEDVLKALEEKWQEVAAEQAQNSENFKKAWESYTAFRAQYAKWKKIGFVK